MSPAKKPLKRSAGKSVAKPKTASKRAAHPERNLGDELLGRCERVVELALSRGADEAEVYTETQASLGVELEAGRLGTTGASQGAGSSIRLVKDGRLGFAYWTDATQVNDAIDRALQQSRLAPKLDFHFPRGGPTRSLPMRWDDRIAALDVADAITLANDLLVGAKSTCKAGLLAGGGASLEHGTLALASSAGVAVWERSTSVGASASLVLKDGQRSVSAGESRSAHTFTLDAREVGAEAGRTTTSLKGPKPANAKGTADLLLRPEAALDLVLGLVVSSATGDEALRGKTVWSKSLGKNVASKDIDLVDDSWVPHSIGGAAFDGDGQPTKRLPILDGGVLRNFLFDAWDANRHGKTSTHSAVRGGFKSRPETGTQHLVLSSRKARDFAKIIAGTDDGYLVESVLGAHTANVTTGDFSVTSPNVWRVRKGAIVGPVTEIAIGGNLPELLKRIDGVGKQPKIMDGSQVPGLRFRDVVISS